VLDRRAAGYTSNLFFGRADMVEDDSDLAASLSSMEEQSE